MLKMELSFSVYDFMHSHDRENDNNGYNDTK